MKFVQEEMQNDFKKDLKEGKIFGLRLVKTDNEVIKRNVYAEVFDTILEITRFDENKFYTLIRRREPHYIIGSYNGRDYQIPDYSIPTFDYEETEGYFSAFNYYDGNVLRATVDIPAAVDPKDSLKITEYEVIRSY